MRALATSTATRNSASPSSSSSSSTSSSGTARPSSRHQSSVPVLSTSGGKSRPVVRLRKQPSAANVLIATTTTTTPRYNNRFTTTRTTISSAPATPSLQSNSSILPPRPSFSPSAITTTTRLPLRARDKNAAPTRSIDSLKRPQAAVMSASSKPPAGSRVQTPSLSAGAARALNKPPLTPKIAARGLRTPQQQTVSVPAPLSRTPLQRSESATSSKDEVASPLDAFLSNNITPRSGSRQSRVIRVDSASSTPTGTPNPDNHDTWETRSGLGITAAPAVNPEGMRRPVVSFSSLPEAGPSGLTRQDPDSKFFYASEAAKSQPSQAAQQPRHSPAVTLQQKAPTFFYANGTTVPEPRQIAAAASPTPVLAAPPAPQDSLMSKFVYANATRDTQLAARPNVVATTSGSVVSTASKAPAPRLATPSTSAPGYSQQRPASPIKLASFSSTKNTSTPSLSSPRTNLGPIPSLGAASSVPQRRSIPDIDTPSLPRSRGGHSRNGSVATIPEPPAVARLVPATTPSRPSSEASSPSNLSSTGFNPPLPTAAAGFASLLQAAEDFTSSTAETTPAEDATASNDPAAFAASGPPQSPTKSSAQEQALTELVATARRERKVQDLEITNASLEAINRTLERQLRKQTAEIRRYRRLSRLSLASVGSGVPPGGGGGGGGDRIVSDGSVAGGALARAGLALDDLSEEEESDAERDALGHEEEDEDADEYDLSPSESGSAEASPGARALRNARRRRRDEQRLQLDLSKHQQLLVDSQKINQSLRRCLGWTEELIKEGRRALEYKVRVSEVELGGRVLAPEEVEGEHDESRVDEEETLHAVTFDLAGATEERWSKEPQDRDSGVDFPADGG